MLRKESVRNSVSGRDHIQLTYTKAVCSLVIIISPQLMPLVYMKLASTTFQCNSHDQVQSRYVQFIAVRCVAIKSSSGRVRTTAGQNTASLAYVQQRHAGTKGT